MTRYFVYAAVIVFAAILTLLAIGRWTRAHDANESSVAAQAGSPRPEGASTFSPPPVVGDAPWALSALPSCFLPGASVGGSPAYVASRKPALGVGISGPVSVGRLAVADCVLIVQVDSALVVRGDTRLRIPPDAHFYVAGRRLVLDWTGNDREDVRTYTLRDGRVPHFTSR